MLGQLVRHHAAHRRPQRGAQGLVPIGVRDFIADNIIGVYHTMEDFTSRAGQQSLTSEMERLWLNGCR